jgi:hypothetical protein
MLKQKKPTAPASFFIHFLLFCNRDDRKIFSIDLENVGSLSKNKKIKTFLIEGTSVFVF